MLGLFGVDDKGVLPVVGVVDADVPGADAVSLLLVEVDAEVETVVGGQAEVVAAFDEGASA